jgi:CheY-like chemotaxis protein
MSDRVSRILIVDDDAIVAESIAQYLATVGYDTAFVTNGDLALDALNAAEQGEDTSGKLPRPFVVMIVDMSMPGMNGLELIKRTRETFPNVVPIVITGYGTIEAAVKAIRHGAIDYLTKPLVDDELRIAVEKAVRQQALLAENSILRRQLDQRYGLDNIIGSDERMRKTYRVIPNSQKGFVRGSRERPGIRQITYPPGHWIPGTPAFDRKGVRDVGAPGAVRDTDPNTVQLPVRGEAAFLGVPFGPDGCSQQSEVATVAAVHEKI